MKSLSPRGSPERLPLPIPVGTPRNAPCAATAQDAGRMLPLLRYFTVFNVEQCDGLTDVPATEAKTHEHQLIAEAEALWNAWTDKPAVTHQGNAAAYRREADRHTSDIRLAFRRPGFGTHSDVRAGLEGIAHENFAILRRAFPLILSPFGEQLVAFGSRTL